MKINTEKQIPIETLRELFSYDPATGVLTRRDLGRVVGSLRSDGYLSATVKYRSLLVHRIVFACYHGRWPNGRLDHKNEIKSDNKIENLREATNSQNVCNCGKRKTNTSGVKGVHFYKPTGKWMAQLQIDGRKIFVGYFTEISDAKSTLEQKRAEMHGEFANHGG